MSIEETIYRRSPVWAQNLLLNLHGLRIRAHRYGSPLTAAVQNLLESERWPSDLLVEWQNDRLRTMVAHAFERSPYYRALMQSLDIRPKDIQTISDLPKLPLLTKDIVR